MLLIDCSLVIRDSVDVSARLAELQCSWSTAESGAGKLIGAALLQQLNVACFFAHMQTIFHPSCGE